jgi:hypothetical protein
VRQWYESDMEEHNEVGPVNERLGQLLAYLRVGLDRP